MMGSREGLRERGIQRGSRLVRDLATEWHGLRLAAGVSQKELARALGISRETYSRIERGKTPAVTVARAAAITAILGSELSVKTYPIGQPIRDNGQLAVLERFEQPLAHLARHSRGPNVRAGGLARLGCAPGWTRVDWHRSGDTTV